MKFDPNTLNDAFTWIFRGFLAAIGIGAWSWLSSAFEPLSKLHCGILAQTP